MNPTHEKIEELIAAYALDALEFDTRGEVQAELLEHIAGCDACRQVFHDLREVSADLALGAAPVPVSELVERRIKSAIRGESQHVRSTGARRSVFTKAILAAALAAVLALSLVNISVTSHLRRERNDVTRTSQALSLLNDASAYRTTLKASGTTGSVSLAVAKDGRAVLIGSGLSKVPSGHVLELWLMRAGQPIPSGVFIPEGGIAIVSLVIEPKTYSAVAITVEKGPAGVRQPTTNQIFSGMLEA